MDALPMLLAREMTVMRAVLLALVESHPNPQALAEAWASHRSAMVSAGGYQSATGGSPEWMRLQETAEPWDAAIAASRRAPDA